MDKEIQQEHNLDSRIRAGSNKGCGLIHIYATLEPHFFPLKRCGVYEISFLNHRFGSRFHGIFRIDSLSPLKPS